MNFTAMLDTESLAALARMSGFGALLEPEITQALSQAGSLVVTTAQANTWNVFANPTGNLASSIYFFVPSPEEVAVSVGVPYGHRREYGFSGQTDSLGRFYPYDPGKPYLVPALEEDEPMILMLIERAAAQVLSEIGGGV